MNVIPFRGYRYNKEVVGDPGNCIAPPYDVLDRADQERLYELNDYNFVRIIKTLPENTGGEKGDVYRRAAQNLNDFIAAGALRQDDRESIYVYKQGFTVLGRTFRRSGFVALGQLASYGQGIRPHEKTLDGPKADRLQLMRATASQSGQIFMLYSDPTRTIDGILTRAAQGEPLLSHTDPAGVTHELFRITNPDELATICGAMSHRDVFIADGHHRFETALQYYQETGDSAAAHCMMTFVNTHNEGLVILPTHRLVRSLEHFSPAKLLVQVREHFDVARLMFDNPHEKDQKFAQMFDALQHEFDAGEHAFGMYFGENAFYLATLHDREAMARVAPDHSRAWCELDVAVLHKLILEKHLGINEEALSKESHLDYIKDIGSARLQAMEAIDAGEAQAVFFVNPTRIAQVEGVAATGEKMPQKSTFFYPKVFSGLVLNVLHPSAADKPKRP